ncbi:ABC transporter ATP-binding protein [Fusobacterium sp.]|uniref:ABC transporter ATP-binding protein n=1 Tax=Fusobacterium sp. TaxID=68766 RepID=UPI0025BE62C9|nr:ABC transporter ATP-binding protein [Fusobacterium sp.]
MGLKLDRLTLKYREKVILQDISLDIKKGDVVAILGPNGVGKTTLLKGILSLINSDGNCYLDEVNLKKCSLVERAKYLAYVPQSTNINFSITVIDYICMGKVGNEREDKIEILKKANELIKVLELERLALKDIFKLSGGERQKVMIAKAIIQDTKVIVLDEPTSNLDIKSQKKVLEFLKLIASEKDLIIIMSIHDLGLANKYCNKFLFLKDKKIFAYGNNSEVLTKENIEVIYETDIEIIQHKGRKKILIV